MNEERILNVQQLRFTVFRLTGDDPTCAPMYLRLQQSNGLQKTR